ncbi:hypothetical protein C2S52_007417 [Perilla frutescens var. hirtella]|nr:hypothetical protein C2S52_007417 [Perilla frutescens var. hirtella]
MKQFSYADTYPTADESGLKPLTPTDGANVYFSSDQVSFSFDCSDFGWGENCAKTPEISYVLSTVLEDEQAHFTKDSAKANLENLVSSDDLSAFDSQMKLFQMPYLESNWDASIDAFLNGDETQDDAADYKPVHLIALQVTLFPGRGICLDIVNLHGLGDGSSVNASIGID